MTSTWKHTLSDLLMQLFRKPARAEAENEVPLHPNPANHGGTRRRDENVNPPHNLPKENLTAEERERRIKEANRIYWKAMGSIESFWAAYPYERPPGHEPEPQRDTGRKHGGGR
jgi:hypothetical protein